MMLMMKLFDLRKMVLPQNVMLYGMMINFVASSLVHACTAVSPCDAGLIISLSDGPFAE
jgi:hypothetical protein